MFDTLLEEMVETVPGARGAILMGYDGIAVAEYARGDGGGELNLLTVEYANVLKEIRKSSSVLEIGQMEEVLVRTDHFCIILRSLTDEYFCAMILFSEGNLGKGRYVMLRELHQLASRVA